MRQIRLWHFYLGCFFSPLIIYFAVSGAWQLFRFNDVPKNQPPDMIRSILHELSKPHTESTLPTSNTKTQKSVVFNFMALVMAISLTITAFLGIAIALQSTRKKHLVIGLLLAGFLIPILMLFL